MPLESDKIRIKSLQISPGPAPVSWLTMSIRVMVILHSFFSWIIGYDQDNHRQNYNETSQKSECKNRTDHTSMGNELVQWSGTEYWALANGLTLRTEYLKRSESQDNTVTQLSLIGCYILVREQTKMIVGNFPRGHMAPIIYLHSSFNQTIARSQQCWQRRSQFRRVDLEREIAQRSFQRDLWRSEAEVELGFQDVL